MRHFLLATLLCGLAACSAEPDSNQFNAAAKVETSGKRDVALSNVPPDVLIAAVSARAGFTATQAQSETRDGRSYYDVEGTLPDGSEIEFDILQDGGRWKVVEAQRDIEFGHAPEPVQQAALAKDRSLIPSRVIESTQADGVVIYEMFSPTRGDPQGRKIEVKWDGRAASLLTEEWAH